MSEAEEVGAGGVVSVAAAVAGAIKKQRQN